jgi:hypothetical protein
MTRRVPDPLLEKLHLGELPAADAERLRVMLTEADRERLDALAADDAAILSQHPPAVMAGAVRRRAAAQAPAPAKRSPAWMALPLAAAAAAALALALPGTVPPTGAGPEPGVQVESEHVLAKGDARLLVYRKTPKGAEALAPGARAAAGDELRLGFIVDDAQPGALVSVDGRGAVTPHFPVAGREVLPRGRTLLDSAYALDDAPAFERFFLVSGPGVALDDVVRAAEALAKHPDADTRPLSLPTGWRQTDFLIRKGTEATP